MIKRDKRMKEIRGLLGQALERAKKIQRNVGRG